MADQDSDVRCLCSTKTRNVCGHHQELYELAYGRGPGSPSTPPVERSNEPYKVIFGADGLPCYPELAHASDVVHEAVARIFYDLADFEPRQVAYLIVSDVTCEQSFRSLAISQMESHRRRQVKASEVGSLKED